MSKIEIRRVHPSEMDHWFEMRIESLRESPSAFMSSPETELAQGVEVFRERIANGENENLIFAAFDGETIAGSVGLVRDSALKARHKATIWGMYVRPAYRNQKLGKQLLSAAIKFAKSKMKVEKLDLSVDSAREPAKQLYSSLGFKKWGVEERAVQIDGKYFDEDYMSLFLI
jgi:RimJ/RimL family protein N-acetyltransferase